MKQEILLKGCPRDMGDLIPEKDHYGSYVYCLQCGQEYYNDKEGNVILDTPYKIKQATPRKGSRERHGGYRIEKSRA